MDSRSTHKQGCGKNCLRRQGLSLNWTKSACYNGKHRDSGSDSDRSSEDDGSKIAQTIKELRALKFLPGSQAAEAVVVPSEGFRKNMGGFYAHIG
jgi:hypothetical protein